MGIELTNVLPVKDHLYVCNCALCSNLVSLDGYVAVSCGHCFCQRCFRAWTETQDSKSSAPGCPTCGVKIASGESDGVVDWEVQTLVEGNPLVHRMLSHVKVVCPCRFSSRMCYWTGDYSDLKQHITTSHAQPTAHEQTSKSCITPESASDQQEPTSWPYVEDGSQSERTKQRKSDHVRKLSSCQQQVQAMEERGKAISHKMQKRRSVSISEIPNKSHPNVRNNFNAIQGGHQSEHGLTAEGIRWSGGKRELNRETSIGFRLNDFNSERSFPKREYHRQKPPYTSMVRSISPTSSSPDAALNIHAPRHQSDAALDTRNNTFLGIKSCQGQALENSNTTASHRMNRRRSQSMSDVPSNFKRTVSNAFKVSHRRLQSGDENSADDTRWHIGTRGSSTETSMGSGSAEGHTSRSFRESVEYQRQRAPSTIITRCKSPSSLQPSKPSAAPRDADLNTDVRVHHSGTALDASNDTSKSTDQRSTNETIKSLTRIDGPRRKASVNTRTRTSMPTALAPEVSSSNSKMYVRLVEHQDDRESSPSSHRVERKKKGVGASLSPVRRNHQDSPSIGSIPSSSLPLKGPRNQNLANLERQANLAYKEGKYTIAHDLYTMAIDAYMSSAGDSPTDVTTELIALLYVNRAAVCIKQNMFRSCVKDCDAALSLNKRLPRACLRKARTLSDMGLFADACAAASSGLKDNPGNLELERVLVNCKMLRIKFALVQSFLDVKKYKEARTLLLETPSSLRCAVILQCKADLGLGNADKVLEALNPDILQNDFMGSHGIELIAEAHFQNGNIDQGIQEATRAQSCCLDRSQNSPRLQLYQEVHSLMLKGQIAAKKRRFSNAVELLSSAISKWNDVLLPPKAVLLQKLHLLRSDAHLQAKEFPQCLDDTARVIALDDTCAEAWTTRVKALEGMRQYDVIANELNVVVAKLDDAFLQSAYENALGLGPPATSVDLYALFGVSRDASVEEIMVQFQIKVAECESECDCEVEAQNFIGVEMAEEERQTMEKKRIYLEKGRSILCDSFLRSQYDAGKNVDSIRLPMDELCYLSKSA